MSSPDSLTMYFAYGSNLWLDQMRRRCPESRYIGTALLPNWKWIINTAGYANVIRSPHDEVYGMIYALTAEDERKLDGFEGVPYNYIKEIIPTHALGNSNHGIVKKEQEIVNALVYVDVQRLEEGPPREEYIHRINMAVKDALKEGIPQKYVDKYIRRFIPPDHLKN